MAHIRANSTKLTFSIQAHSIVPARGAAFAFSALLALANPTFAADLKAPKAKSAPPIEANVADVPGDDIFGFTSPSDIGKPGDSGLALENDGR
ncbi:MAG: hypothetical protein EBY21_13795, partial [Alphaproteobacteria bacterium]|nr:hypothetical protein [Alphaproteobacteria bacterium]